MQKWRVPLQAVGGTAVVLGVGVASGKWETGVAMMLFGIVAFGASLLIREGSPMTPRSAAVVAAELARYFGPGRTQLVFAENQPPPLPLELIEEAKVLGLIRSGHDGGDGVYEYLSLTRRGRHAMGLPTAVDQLIEDFKERGWRALDFLWSNHRS